MIDVARWLAGLGLGDLTETFARNQIDGDVLADLTDEHLKELGLPLGARLKLLKAIKSLDTHVETPAPRGEAERRQLTVMFADLEGSTRRWAGRSRATAAGCGRSSASPRARS